MDKDKKNEPKIDVDALTEEQKKEYYRKPKILPWVIVFSVFLVIIVALVIVINNLPA